MNSLQEYKCPSCGGVLEFDPHTQQLKCPYCDNVYSLETVQQYDDVLNEVEENEVDWKAQAGGQYSGEEYEHLRVYSCKSCGGEVVTDETTAAQHCPYCGNAIVMMNNFKGLLRPDYVVPFKYNKKQAIEAYKKHLVGKKYLPRQFKDENHMDEIKGVYVPFWMYDADVEAYARMTATKTHSWSDSNYNYVDTEHYSLYRSGEMGFENVPSNGSTKADDALMESIEPFDMTEAVPFQTAYLAGYYADKYDVDDETSAKTANSRIRTTSRQKIQDTVTGYDSVETDAVKINLLNENVKYCLLPVWLLTTTFEGERYYFAMNGQTGKLVGDLPFDTTAVRKDFFKVMIICLIVIFAAMVYFGM